MTKIHIITRTDPNDHSTSRVLIIGSSDNPHAHKSMSGAGDQGLSPIIFPEAPWIGGKYIGFSGQKMELTFNLNFILSTNDLSLDLAANSTVDIIDPTNATFENGTIKTTAEQFQWLFEYVWVAGSERQTWLYIEGLPPFNKVNNSRAITAITQANPGVVTTNGNHGFENGDFVFITDVEGMTEINGIWYEVANKAATIFELTAYDGGANINTTGFGAWSAGGVVGKLPNGVNCVIASPTFGLSPEFLISKKISVSIGLKVGSNLI